VKKNILLTVIVLVVGFCVGVLVPYTISERTSGVKVDKDQLKINVQNLYKEDLIMSYVEKYEADQIEKIKSKYSEENGSTVGMPEVQTLTGSEKEIIANSIMSNEEKPASGTDAELATDDPDKGTTPSGSNASVKDAWIQDIIDRKADHINMADLAEGSSIYNKLDTGYLFGLAEGGLTEEERNLALDYLHSNLSQQEFSKAAELYMKYVGLLNN
jgi:hypothetical protein